MFRLEMRLTYFDISESGNCREANSLQIFFLLWKKFVEQDTELFFIWLHALTCTETVDTFSHEKRFESNVLFIDFLPSNKIVGIFSNILLLSIES